MRPAGTQRRHGNLTKHQEPITQGWHIAANLAGLLQQLLPSVIHYKAAYFDYFKFKQIDKIIF